MKEITLYTLIESLVTEVYSACETFVNRDQDNLHNKINKAAILTTAFFIKGCRSPSPFKYMAHSRQWANQVIYLLTLAQRRGLISKDKSIGLSRPYFNLDENINLILARNTQSVVKSN